MGFIQAIKGSVSGTLADQWKEFLVPSSTIKASVVVSSPVLQSTNAGRGVNTKGSQNIISNGSKIVVPEGMALVTMQEGKISNLIMEAGGYEFNSNDINAKSIFSGDDIIEATIRQSWERFKFGGQPGSSHTAYYVNLKEIPGNKFGTQSEIYWDDAFMGTQVGAITRGTYSLKVVDPILFIKQFVPTEYLVGGKVFDLSDMNSLAVEQLFNEVVGTLSAAFSIYANDPNKGNRISKIQSDQLGFAKCLSSAIEDAYQWKSERGLEIESVSIVAIEYDEDTKKLLSDVKKADALSGNRGNSFMQQSVARGMQAMGESGQNAASGMAFMGIGMNSAGNMMGNLQQQVQAQAPIQQQSQAQEDPYAKLAQLKALLDQGVITQEDFDAAKKKTLGI
ncbi:MAG: SPFH domain-containing protein [Lachnospirales bacterium]